MKDLASWAFEGRAEGPGAGKIFNIGVILSILKFRGSGEGPWDSGHIQYWTFLFNPEVLGGAAEGPGAGKIFNIGVFLSILKFSGSRGGPWDSGNIQYWTFLFNPEVLGVPAAEGQAQPGVASRERSGPRIARRSQAQRPGSAPGRPGAPGTAMDSWA